MDHGLTVRTTQLVWCHACSAAAAALAPWQARQPGRARAHSRGAVTRCDKGAALQRMQHLEHSLCDAVDVMSCTTEVGVHASAIEVVHLIYADGAAW